MQYFAKVLDLSPHNNNIVQEVLSVTDSDCYTDGGVIKESIGAAFLEALTGHSNWIMCYRGPTNRGVYPGPGDFWDPTNKIFYKITIFNYGFKLLLKKLGVFSLVKYVYKVLIKKNTVIMYLILLFNLK